jgi:4-amino-4-deoxy-L-arabinose transferase-like glycosyltransferase
MGIRNNFSIRERFQEIAPKYVIAIFLVALGIRLILFAVFQPWNPVIEREFVLKSDMLGYHQLAITLLESHRFINSSSNNPESLRTPLYPIFIAVIYFLFGHKPWVVMLFQITLDAFASIVLLFAFFQLFSRRVALIAAAFYALDTFLILYSSTTLYSDSFFVFFTCCCILVYEHHHLFDPQKRALLYCGLSSLFLGLATLVKPISQYILVFYLAYFIMVNRKYLRTAFLYSAVALVVFGLILTPWLFRNYHNFGYFSLSSSAHTTCLYWMLHQWRW